ncbi:hypothetical protein Ccrd_004404 [Cynara cardunculus var. scolymus]|uniref:Uncharacterized protein n=1 Tax=Cynara cardunculus var. scolymus TaxID=59895 RepID=A0A103XMK9_CYNCS|nr:hypothetical protein Ccrd_004404 [Cynara cardunculus var. scolymus]
MNGGTPRNQTPTQSLGNGCRSDKNDGFHDLRTKYKLQFYGANYAGNAGLVAALVALLGDKTTKIDKNTIFSTVPPMFPTLPPAPWEP